MYVWGPEVKHRCHFSGAIHLGFCFVCFETGSLIVLELACRVGWTGWPASLRDPPISTSPALRLHVHNHIQVFFYVGSDSSTQGLDVQRAFC